MKFYDKTRPRTSKSMFWVSRDHTWGLFDHPPLWHISHWWEPYTAVPMDMVVDGIEETPDHVNSKRFPWLDCGYSWVQIRKAVKMGHQMGIPTHEMTVFIPSKELNLMFIQFDEISVIIAPLVESD